MEIAIWSAVTRGRWSVFTGERHITSIEKRKNNNHSATVNGNRERGRKKKK